MIKNKKRYIVWIRNDGNYFSPTEFDTVEEALISNKYGDDWYLTEGLNYISGSAYYHAPKDEDADSSAI